MRERQETLRLSTMRTSFVDRMRPLTWFAAALLPFTAIGAVPGSRVEAAGIPPSISFDFHCSGDDPQVGWTATNTDLGAHTLDIVTNYGGADIPTQTVLAVGVASTGSTYGTVDGALHRVRIYEDGGLLADSELMVADVSLPTCWKLWEEPSEEPEGGWGPAGPPLVTFITSCDNGGGTIEAVLTNVDGLAHAAHAAIEIFGDDPGVFDFDISLAAGKLHAGTGTVFVGLGVIVQVTVTEADTLLATSPMFLLTDQEPTCHFEVAPVGESTTTTTSTTTAPTTTTTAAATTTSVAPADVTTAATTTTAASQTQGLPQTSSPRTTGLLPQTGPSATLPIAGVALSFLLAGMLLTCTIRRRQAHS